MIDWKKSAELNGMSVDDLKDRFLRFPMSDKKVIAVCEGCGIDREVYIYAYYDLCRKCSHNTFEYRKTRSKNSIKQWSDPIARSTLSEIKKKSVAAKVAIGKQIGGNDIIQHHYLYDNADLSKYTMPMTRSEHATMHNRMRWDGYEVPHINSETDYNELWGYSNNIIGDDK